MAWNRWALFFSLVLLLSPVCVSAEPKQQQSRSGFRRLYVLQPGPGPGAGPGGADSGGVRVSSISSLHGASGPAHTYNVELSARYGGQVRTRRMGNQAAPIPQYSQHQQVQSQEKQQLLKLSGVNVCGGQCCHGWTKSQGSQRCTKPNCLPHCQNGGMCLRPQLCVCKPGSKGKACEQKTMPTHSFPAQPGNGPTNGHTTVHTNGHTNGQNVVPQRPIPQQALPQGYASASPPANNMAQMRLTVNQAPHHLRQQYIQQHIQQQVRSIPMLPGQSQQYVVKPKYYHTHSTHTHVQPQPERPIPLTVGHSPIHVGNHTGRIKVVFTPTICKVTCMGGRCHNNCERGNTTTIISENGRATDTLTAPNFRVVVCHLPCINGGTCSARDKCHCPPSHTGKFCQMPIQNGQHQQAAGGYSQTQVHSTHTLPLTYSNGQNHVFSPSIVNIHIKHPPEASVQVHQVSQLDNYHNNGHVLKGPQPGSSSSTSYSYHHSESSQKVQHHGYNIVYPGQNGYQVPQYQPVTSKSQLGRCFQETIGSQCGKALPGLSKQEDCCATIGTSWGFHKCQKCPRKPSLPLIDCPQGYKLINHSHCQDLNECQLQGVCPNGDCLNTVGSYRCICKPGFIPDPSLSKCISNTPAIQEEKGACFRLVSSGRQCLHPVSAQLSKQLCCCSVGKAWGPHCDKCPLPGTAKFKEICPGGMGYTVLPNPPVNKPVTVHQESMDPLPPQPLPTPEKPVEAFGKPDEVLPEVVERNSPPAPVEILPSNAGQDIAPTQSAEVDECQINPYICGRGVCYNTAAGYTCHCLEGYQLDDAQTTCVDIDECLQTPSLCHGGRCRNTVGSFLCVCPQGFVVDEEGTSCMEVDECQINPYICGHGVCYNTAAGYTCHCQEGYQLDDPQTTCVDIDECQNRTVCPSGICHNVPGGYNCGSCQHGYLGQGGQCVDIDECQNERVCTRGHCQNTEGSFICHCESGFRLSPAGDQCDDVDECREEARPCEAVGACVNNMGSYTCTCPQGYRQINGTICRDVDECVDDAELCSPHGECLNTEGSYQCVCESGFTTNVDTPSCDDIDECGIDETICGPHGYCENRMGSYWCLCSQHFQVSQDGRSCEDLNECELLSRMCGDAQCENVEGSFLCVCPSGQEYNTMIAKCEPIPTASPIERKECYYRLNDENLCESVLTSHVTLQECCCTLGAGWGDDCEVHPCPVNGTDQFNQMCPSGRGFIPTVDELYGVPTTDSYKDADECALFGEEVCKRGFCLDTVGSYECYCKTGQDYDPARMECTDINECLDESVCVGRQCINTEGSYMCFCMHPMVLDPSTDSCVFIPEVAEQHETEQVDYQGICWQTVTQTMTCTRPLGPNRKTTYTECCCLYGEAWGMDCALCPLRNTADYASMCNLPVGGGGRRPYGRDALVAGPIHEYEVSPDYSPEQRAVLPFYEEEEEEEEEGEDSYKAFEGLRAEECGILNGCENGRCVRVQEGYTCDCFDGYTLDMSRMACIDVNECSELNNRMSLCKNGRCINTVGSYQCVCLPGFTTSDKPNYCVEATAQQASARTQ
ncbi:latent-transforming growth factor beta-binding protein 1 isoform X2 [Genypterus blacodes]|uniref:latent-transforming growth factor beta-binding protein 1 isoform X2 n=1 Tax=Genypterus blacodes TaxID=154954 RepID=UPI003F763068